jgi:phosphoglycolate phosphatase
MKHLLVFDLDGTLVDSRRDLAESANELLSTYGAASLGLDEVTRMVGEGARVLVERVLRARRLEAALDPALERFLDIYERRLTNHTRPYPGIVSMLDALAPHATLAVLTNKPARHTALLVEALGLAPYFFAVLGLGVLPRKPEPAGLLHLMGLAGVSQAETIMIGDSPVDLETAHRAGVRPCVLHYGFGDFTGIAIPPAALQVSDSMSLGRVLLGAIHQEPTGNALTSRE